KILRRRSRCARVRERDGGRAAFAGRAAGWARAASGDDARASEPRAMSGALRMSTRPAKPRAKNLATLLQGIAPERAPSAHVSDLTLDKIGRASCRERG